MVGSIPYAIAFGIYHVIFKDIQHDNVVSFWPFGMVLQT